MADNKKKRAARPSVDEGRRDLMRKAGICCAVAVAGIAAGAVGGHMLWHDTGASATTGKAEVSESDLGKAFGTYTYHGKTETVSVEDAIQVNSTLQQNDDGNYDVPSAESVLDLARSRVMKQVAIERGIEVTDDEIDEYVSTYLGYDSVAEAAEGYGYEEDDFKGRVTDSLRMSKLYADVTDNADGVGSAPDAPEKTGDADEVTQAYADYVIGLAGDEWDRDKNTWASEDSTWATTCSGMTMSNTGASYEAAQAAYQLAYQQWSARLDEVASKWTDFCNDVYKDITVTIGGAQSAS